MQSTSPISSRTRSASLPSVPRRSPRLSRSPSPTPPQSTIPPPTSKQTHPPTSYSSLAKRASYPPGNQSPNITYTPIIPHSPPPTTDSSSITPSSPVSVTPRTNSFLIHVLLISRPRRHLPEPLFNFPHVDSFVAFPFSNSTLTDIATFPRSTDPLWQTDTPLSDIIARLNSFHTTYPDIHITSTTKLASTFPEVRDILQVYLPPIHFHKHQDPLLQSTLQPTFYYTERTHSLTYPNYLLDMPHPSNIPTVTHCQYNFIYLQTPLLATKSHPTPYYAHLAKSLNITDLEYRILAPLLIPRLLHTIPKTTKSIHIAYYIRQYLLPLRILIDHFNFAQHPLRTILFCKLYAKFIPVLTYPQFERLLPANPSIHAHQSILDFNRLVHSFAPPNRYYPITPNERHTLCKHLGIHNPPPLGELDDIESSLLHFPSPPSYAMEPTHHPATQLSAATSPSRTRPPSTPLTSHTSNPPLPTHLTASPTFPPLVPTQSTTPPTFSLFDNPAPSFPLNTSSQAQQLQQFQLFQQFLNFQQTQQQSTTPAASLLNPSTQPLTLDSLWNTSAAPPPTMADIQNYTRLNPRSITRYQTDNIVRQLDNLFLDNTNTPHAKDEARALRLLHQHLNREKFVLLLQNYFNRHNSFPFPRNTYWRTQASIHVDAWHRPEPEQPDLATALTTLTRRLTLPPNASRPLFQQQQQNQRNFRNNFNPNFQRNNRPNSFQSTPNRPPRNNQQLSNQTAFRYFRINPPHNQYTPPQSMRPNLSSNHQSFPNNRQRNNPPQRNNNNHNNNSNSRNFQTNRNTSHRNPTNNHFRTHVCFNNDPPDITEIFPTDPDYPSEDQIQQFDDEPEYDTQQSPF